MKDKILTNFKLTIIRILESDTLYQQEITQKLKIGATQEEKLSALVEEFWDDIEVQSKLRIAHEKSEEEFNREINSLYGVIRTKLYQIMK